MGKSASMSHVQQKLNDADRPPPAKRVKSNPVITRYAPPPGYMPPMQSPAPHQQQAWPPQMQAPAYGQQHYHGYPPGAYVPYSQHPQHQWQGYSQQPPQHIPNYPPQQQPHALTVPAPASSSGFGEAPGNPANWQIPPSGAPYSTPPESFPPANFFPRQKRRHQSEPFVSANAAPPGPILDGNGDELPSPSPSRDTHQSPNDNFDDECYFLRHPENIDQSLSIGELTWHPAQPTILALPSTWKESQLEIIAPRKEPAEGEDCVSEYFSLEKREETLLSIRLTDEWWNIRKDMIFKEFEARPKTLLPLAEMLQKYRNRPDPSWLPPTTPESAMPSDAVDEAPKNTIYSHTNDDIDTPSVDEDGDILGSLEQALRQNSSSRHGRHSRANSTTSVTSNQSRTKLKPLMPVRDRAQDDVLATLGVTGSPKLVYQTPGPAFGPPPSQPREGSVSRNHSRQSSVASNSSTSRAPPPPPPGQPLYSRRPSHHDTRRSYKQAHYNGYDGSRRGSNASHSSSRPGSRGSHRPGSSGSRHTASGSDFGGGDDDRTPRAKYHGTESRKRGYGDYDNAYRDEDATPRQYRYKQPRMDGGRDQG